MPKKRYGDSPLASASAALAVVPHDVNEVVDANGTTYPRALYVGGAGNLTVRLADDSADVLLSNVPAGTILNIQAKLVKATGTTATLIVALF